MPGCLFCAIVDGSVPSTRVAESERAYAFRDVNPCAPVHVLVVPKTHVDGLDTLCPSDAAVLGDLFSLIGTVAGTLGVAKSGYRVVANVGADGGQAVRHLHFHVIGGEPLGWPPTGRRGADAGAAGGGPGPA